MKFPVDRIFWYLITEGHSTSRDFLADKISVIAKIKDAVEDGVSMIQIREKGLTAKQVFELTKAVRQIVPKNDAILLVNERADIAVAAGADGVHLRSDAVRPSIIRKMFPRDFIVGVSTHSAEEVTIARNEGADFAVFGPIFETAGKGSPVGLEKLVDVCDAAGEFPVIALGGVNETNAAAVMDAGAAGLAAIRALNDKRARRQILKKIGSGFVDPGMGYTS